jgi:hypothetical protein
MNPTRFTHPTGTNLVGNAGWLEQIAVAGAALWVSNG